jgi:GH24 family phage-related lysozyme (muramidase)
MHTSRNGIELIKKYEGLYLHAYKCPAGVLTIGYGTTNADKEMTCFTINKNTTITKAKAEELLKKSIEKKYEPLVNKYNEIYKFNQNEYDALISFCYNIGSITQLTQKGKRTKKEIAVAMVNYNHAGGKVLKGLTRRREEEKKLFLTPVKQVNKQDNKQDKKQNNKKNMYVVTSEGLNVRAGTGKKYKVLNVLKKGDEVEIDKVVKNWGRIKNVNRWICLNYTKKL